MAGVQSAEPARRRRVAGVFLDFEGTLNDSRASARLYAKELASRLAREGSVDESRCGRAASEAMVALRRLQQEVAADQTSWPGYASFRQRELRVWIKTLLEVAGLPVPEDARLMGLAHRLESEIPVFFVPLVGALEAVAGLRALGLRLFVASAAPSSYVRRCLEIAGLVGSFEAVFGPDVVDGLKCGPEFYRRAFRMAALEPEQCLVVDDSPGPLAWAREAGALAVGVGLREEPGQTGPGGAGRSEPDPDHAAPSFVRTLKELPSVAAAAGDFPELVGGGAGCV